MSTKEPFALKWGILSCGNISTTFTKDLLLDRGASQPTDIQHIVTAAATSNSLSRAQTFLTTVKAPSSAIAYGSYAELIADKDVEIIYIGTPHSHHYQHARACLEAGKHVLCEKAFTVNAEQTKELVKIARAKGLFLMEAVWTRWIPLVREVVGLVRSGKIGDVWRVIADLSFQAPMRELGNGNRLFNMDLAGGAMLDIGIYSITWVFLILYHALPVEERRKPVVASSITRFETGSDEACSIIMNFLPKGTHGVAMSHLRVSDNPDNKHTAGPAVRIQGTEGEIQVYGPSFRPERYNIIPVEDNKTGLEFADVTQEVQGRGMYWQADEAARCIRDGKQESEDMSWEESIVIMEVMDEVRRQGDMVYPDNIESLEYPISELF
ncbi:NAD(P)-binding protein [Microthyrium microscopicum]|uniref:D-xylose 1-dehydrogenase (NADP(+), D-xylono-1,5-lactone-forming) n=1 Tax=Microthyrium microscopicum TaxID=703497 RepID=A0A6A6ULD7_9PEZI|nr:NAD(P)-binding protein [Microthyrium microscopicum]